MVTLAALPDIPEIRPGDDLATILGAAAGTLEGGLRPDDVLAVAPSFGAGSFARHAALAHAAGATVKVCDLPSLGLDVDTPDDLGALREALDAHTGGAARTRAVLDRLVPA